MSKDCTKCKWFMICESWRQFFAKVTGGKCEEFEEVVKDEMQSKQTQG